MSKKESLKLFPTAIAEKCMGKFVLRGVFDVFQLEASSEKELWNELLLYAARNQGAHHRYCVFLNHHRWIAMSKAENLKCAA